VAIGLRNGIIDGLISVDDDVIGDTMINDLGRLREKFLTRVRDKTPSADA